MRALVVTSQVAGKLDLSRSLRSAGWQVEGAATGDDGFELAHWYEFNIR